MQSQVDTEADGIQPCDLIFDLYAIVQIASKAA